MNENIKNERKIMYTQFHNETHVEIFIDLITFHTILKLFH